MSERSIFLSAVDRTDPHEREAYLDEACGGDVKLRQQVEALLHHHFDAGSFLEKPPEELAATIAPGQQNTVDDGAGEIALDFLKPCDKPERIGTLGPYEVIEVVGRGGMGIVVRAHDVKLDRVVGIKIMAPELAANAMAVKRFLREALAAAAVTHDHVVNIHAINDEHRPPFLVMEFVDGLSLQEKIDKSGALELREILRIAMQTASGLAAAHKQGLVHRDIKPANILLENGVERVKITDFGLARAADDVNITRTGIISGTPQYMSPEQARGDVIDHRSDLFALGSVLYAMCTGRPAFRADNPMAVMRRVCHEDPRPIHEINPEIPDWLETIIDKLLAKDAGERFQTAEEVAGLLADWLAHVQQPAMIPAPPMIAVREPGRAPGRRSASIPGTAPRGRWFFRTFRMVTVAGLLIGLLVLAAVLYLKTNDGQLVIKTDGLGDVQLAVKQGDRRIRVIETDAEAGEVTARLDVGEYELEIVGNPPDLELSRDRVVIQRRGVYAVQITRVPSGGRPAGRRDTGTMNVPPTELRAIPHKRFRGWGGALSPDGTKLVRQTGGVGADPNGHLELVDLESGDSQKLLSRGKDPAWSPLPDGPIAAVLHNGGDERIWLIDPESQKVRELAPGGFPSWSSDGKTLFYLHRPSAEVRALAVDVEGAEPRVLWTKCGSIYPAVSPTGKHMAVHTSGRLLVKDLETRRTIASADATDWGGALPGWSPDGRYAAFGSFAVDDNRGLWILDVETGRADKVLPGSFTLPRWSADGKRIVFDHRPSEQVCVVDAQDLLAAHASASRAPAEHGVPGGIVQVRHFKRHLFGIRGEPAVSRDGVLLASLGDGVRIWDIESGTQRTHLPVENESSVVFLTHDPRLVAVGTIDGDVLIWNMQLNRQQRRLAGHAGEVHSLDLSPDGKTLAAASFINENGDAKLWDLESFEPVTLIEEPTRRILFTPDGEQVITASQSDRGTLRIWDTGTHREVAALTDVMSPRHHVEALAVSPDGMHLAVGGGNWHTNSGELLLFDLEHREVLPIQRRLDDVADFRGVAFSPDGRLLAVGASLGRVIILDAKTFEVMESFTAFNWRQTPAGRIVSGLRFLPDGQTLLVSAEFEDAQLWRLPDELPRDTSRVIHTDDAPFLWPHPTAAPFR